MIAALSNNSMVNDMLTLLIIVVIIAILWALNENFNPAAWLKLLVRIVLAIVAAIFVIRWLLTLI